MRRKRIVLTVGAAALAGLLALTLLAGRRPFRNLDAADIQAANVELRPPGVTVELSREEIDTLAELLRAVRITRRDDSWRDCEGQLCRFTLTMTDGTILTASPFGTYVIIDGAGWRTAYKPSEALNCFANGLLDKSK